MWETETLTERGGKRQMSRISPGLYNSVNVGTIWEERGRPKRKIFLVWKSEGQLVEMLS